MIHTDDPVQSVDRMFGTQRSAIECGRVVWNIAQTVAAVVVFRTGGFNECDGSAFIDRYLMRKMILLALFHYGMVIFACTNVRSTSAL